ncbi:MBL fold metallo-hydrolase [Phenylobacterium parvum]|nr:MBL fold metallo-hydrolase [Phenylobacterium parvum]
MNRRHLMAALAALAATPAAAQTAGDGLKVVLAGTSGPLPVRDRAKPCIVVQAAGALYLVDVGPESTENLMTWRLPVSVARAVFLTHLHSDHIGDLGEFNMQSWVQGRERPLALVGPSGVDKVARGFNQAYENDHVFRRAHHERDGFRFSIAAGRIEPRVIRIPAGASTATALRDGDLTVTAIRVSHDPVSPAFGYRFDYRGRSVSISGDTMKWPAFAEASKGVDVMLHEAQSEAMTRQLSQALKGMGNARTSSMMADTLTYHTTPVEAADIARAAGQGGWCSIT